MLTIELPDEVDSRPKALAQATGRTMEFYAREAILKYGALKHQLVQVHVDTQGT